MLDRTLTSALSQGQDGPVTIGGWVETLRDQKRIQFIIIRDESGSVQVTYPRPADEDALADQVSGLSHGSFVIIKGRLKHDERVKLGGVEILLEELEVVGAALADSPIADDTSIDKRLDWRFLDYRRPEVALMLKIQTTIEKNWREHWLENGFVEIHSPKLMGSHLNLTRSYSSSSTSKLTPTWPRARSSTSRCQWLPALGRSSKSDRYSVRTLPSPPGTQPSLSRLTWR